MSVKNWDPKHWFILALFVAGFAWAVWGIVAALPSGSSASAVIAALLPVALLSVSHWMAFFKDPPSDPVQALQEGEQAAGKAGSRGFGRVGILAAITLCGIVGIAAQAMTGCAWWQHNSKTVEQYGEKDVACVFTSVMGGAASYGAVAASCAPLTIEQVSQIASNLFDYYALGQTDSGLVGVAQPPAVGVPARISASDFAKLEAFVKGAH